MAEKHRAMTCECNDLAKPSNWFLKVASMNQLNNLIMRMGRIRFLLILMCVSAGLWIAFAKLVVPPIIESVYRGESLPLLNSLIKGQHENPISYYLQKWDSLTLHYLLNGLGLWLLALVVSS